MRSWNNQCVIMGTCDGDTWLAPMRAMYFDMEGQDAFGCTGGVDQTNVLVYVQDFMNKHGRPGSFFSLAYQGMAAYTWGQSNPELWSKSDQ